MEALMDPVIVVITLIIAVWLFRKITHLAVRIIIIAAAVCIIFGVVDISALLEAVSAGL